MIAIATTGALGWRKLITSRTALWTWIACDDGSIQVISIYTGRTIVCTRACDTVEETAIAVAITEVVSRLTGTGGHCTATTQSVLNNA